MKETELLLKYVTTDFDYLDNELLLLSACPCLCSSTNNHGTRTCVSRDAEHCPDRDQNGVRKHDANINQNIES